MLTSLLRTKSSVAALICGALICVGLLGYWASGRTADARTNLLQGDYATARDQYERAARQGDAVAQNIIGNMHYLGLGVARDHREAARWYLRAAKRGHAPALLNLGILYRYGHGVKQDTVLAYACFRLAEKMGAKNADTHMKFLSFTNQILANMVQEAMTKYRYLPDLAKAIEISITQDQHQQEQPRPLQ